jgi:photosystem II stability/assembly factor-like uncharacterized protein
MDPNHTNILYVGFGKTGGVYKTTTGGNKWERIDNNAFEDVYHIAVDPQRSATVYVAAKVYNGQAGGIFASYDSGATWTRLLNDRSVRQIVIDPHHRDRLYVTTKNDPYYDDYLANGVYKSTDGGQHWKRINANLPTKNINTITIDPNSSQLYLGSACNGIFKSITTTP